MRARRRLFDPTYRFDIVIRLLLIRQSIVKYDFFNKAVLTYRKLERHVVYGAQNSGASRYRLRKYNKLELYKHKQYWNKNVFSFLSTACWEQIS